MYEKSKNRGITLVQSSSVIDGLMFDDFSMIDTGSEGANGIVVWGGSPAIRHTTFDYNYYGAYIDTWVDPQTGEEVPGRPILENNQFIDTIKEDNHWVDPGE